MVTLGVLIALAIGELADYFRWQIRVQKSLSAVRLDLADARYTLLERRVIQPCIERQLRLFDAALKEARRTGRMPRVGGTMVYPMRKFELSSWEVAQSEGITLHMRREYAVMLSTIYSGLATYPGTSTGPETANWSVLMAIPHLAGPIDSSLSSSLTLTLRQAEAQAQLSKQVAEDQEGQIARFGVPIYWPGFYKPDAHNIREIAAAMRAYGVCSPLTLDGGPFRG